MSDDEGFTMTEEDMPPMWETATESPVAITLALNIAIFAGVFLFSSPALVIAIWKWAL